MKARCPPYWQGKRRPWRSTPGGNRCGTLQGFFRAEGRGPSSSTRSAALINDFLLTVSCSFMIEFSHDLASCFSSCARQLSGIAPLSHCAMPCSVMRNCFCAPRSPSCPSQQVVFGDSQLFFTEYSPQADDVHHSGPAEGPGILSSVLRVHINRTFDRSTRKSR